MDEQLLGRVIKAGTSLARLPSYSLILTALALVVLWAA